jgi:glycosidase
MKTRNFLRIGLAAVFLGSLPIGAQDQNYATLTARTPPDWLRKAVVYEIFPRQFSPGGDFNGITARLDELKDLGVTVLWLMPIHPIGEKLKKGTIGSPYAVRDYRGINPDYGTAGDFKRLVSEAHRRDLRVIIDIVANHTSWDSVLMSRPEFYKQDANGKIILPDPGWADVAGLNYDNRGLRRYMSDTLKYWVTDFGVDGFRCDVAGMVPTGFWEAARVELEKVKPDVLMLAEASKPELLLKAFDFDYAWPFHSTLNRVFLEGAPASELRRSWEETRAHFPKGSIHMRISDNHDEARAVARFGIRGALAAQVLILTLDGVPLFYNGMEVGDATESGDPALFEKLPIYWKPKERPPFRSIYRELITLRKNHSAFQNSEVIWLHNSDPANVVSFARRDKHGDFVVIVNLSSRPASVDVDLKDGGTYELLKLSGISAQPSARLPKLNLTGYEWRIYSPKSQ